MQENCQFQISKEMPGPRVPLSQQIIKQLKQLDKKYTKRLTFFGGHPVSMTKVSCNNIFDPKTVQNGKQSPYLLCQKTDGVRYILIVTRYAQYMISRQGQGSVCAYQVQTTIRKEWPQFNLQQQNQNFNQKFLEIVQILDGQIIIDHQQDEQKKIFRFLIFDILVHFGRQITDLPLKERMKLINKFMQANQFQTLRHNKKNPELKNQKNVIECKLKDFFRISIMKFNATQFLLKNYIKCLPHENDGLIYNNQNKPYLFGENDGYIKWKPPHLNTLDFLVVPNSHLVEKYGKKIIDLYLGRRDDQSGVYNRAFYNFTVVPQDVYLKIENLTEKKLQQRQNDQQNNEMQGIKYFQGVIAECSFKDTDSDQKDIFKDIFSKDLQAQDIQSFIMKKNYDDYQLKRIKQLKSKVYIKCWQIYKIRQDKSMPNNDGVTKRIQQSIQDNINDQEIIKRNKELREGSNR